MSGIDAIPRNNRHSFFAKLVAAAGLLALSDLIFFEYDGGSIVAAFALAWLSALLIARPAVRRARHAWIAIAATIAFAALLADDPSLLAVLLFLIAIGSAALLPGHVFDHTGRWLARLSALAVKGVVRAPADLLHLARLPIRGGTGGRAILVHVALPLIGGVVFLALFASANPVLGNALATIRLPAFFTLLLHAMLLVATLSLVWPTLRPRAMRFDPALSPIRRTVADPPVTAMVVALIVFNSVFALENVLDIVFLWSGAPLPAGVTLADYAHRGAYTLIVTALLAATFVLVALRPGSPAANDPLVRRLMLLWVAQNILLVASSAMRLLDYIDAYSLTVLRISAFAWMVLVAVGLVLTCWRLLAGRTAGWLINANALAALAVLSLASVVDLGAMSAAWNVQHLRDPARLDLCYLRSLGTSSLIPITELRDASIGVEMQDRVIYVSDTLHDRLRRDQTDWQSWTLRGTRRLAQAERLLAGDQRTPKPAPYGRACDGTILPPQERYVPANEAASVPAKQVTIQPEALTSGEKR